MEAPLPHPQEARRLQAVRRLKLFGAEPPTVLDELTQALAAASNSAIAMVTVIEQDDVWFLSCVGLPARSGPRALSICGHTILNEDVLIVPDTRRDRRFHDNPSFQGSPGIRAYAGIAIRNEQGLPIGTLCVVDTRPRRFTRAQLDLLRSFARLVRRELQVQADVTATAISLASQRAALDRSEGHFRTFFESSPIGKAFVAFDGHFLRANDALCRMLGYSATEMQQLSGEDITAASDHEADAVHMRRFLSGERDQAVFEKRFLHKDGRPIWVKLTMVLNRPVGEDPYFSVVVENINARKEAEESLRALRLSLERRIEDRTRALEAANERLLAAMTEAVAANQRARERELETRAIIEQAPDAYLSVDSAGTLCDWNEQARRTFGWTRDEVIGKRLDETLVPAGLRGAYRNGLQQAMKAGAIESMTVPAEVQALHRDGHLITVEVRLRMAMVDGQQRANAFLHDISDRKAAEAEHAKYQAQLQLIADNVPAMVGYIDRQLRYVWVNRAYTELLGLRVEEMIGSEVHYFAPESDRVEVLHNMRRALRGETVSYEVSSQLQGRPRHLLVKLVPDVSAERVVGVFGLTVDITDRKALELSLKREALVDELTGLLNRRGFFQAFAEQLRLHRESGRAFALLLLDINAFKAVNDTHGHPAGDRVLAELGRRLATIEGALAARLGGDEFVVLRPVGSHLSIDELSTQALDCFRAPFAIADLELPVSASVGVHEAPVAADDSPESVLCRADESMYVQKRALSKFLRRAGREPA